MMAFIVRAKLKCAPIKKTAPFVGIKFIYHFGEPCRFRVKTDILKSICRIKIPGIQFPDIILYLTSNPSIANLISTFDKF